MSHCEQLAIIADRQMWSCPQHAGSIHLREPTNLLMRTYRRLSRTSPRERAFHALARRWVLRRQQMEPKAGLDAEPSM
jgi:hypothetical protein